ncbi:hypothetical protein DV737_g2982, partial [Chaetothyriales sp. CBS 132003]
MDVLTVYTSATAIWLSLQSITLFLFPRLIIDLLSTAGTTSTVNNNSYYQYFGSTATETYLARLLAVALFTLTMIALYPGCNRVRGMCELGDLGAGVWVVTESSVEADWGGQADFRVAVYE